MTSRDFCYWLQGCLELAQASQSPGEIYFDAKQTEVIRRHLALVFRHEIDPSMGPPSHQKAIDELHGVTVNVPHDPNMRLWC